MSIACVFRCDSIAQFGRDLEMPVRLELGVAVRADVMQHEDRADAGENRLQQMMRAGGVERSQSGADDTVAKLLHQACWAGWMLFER